MKALMVIALIFVAVLIAHLFFDLKWSMYWIDKIYEYNCKCIDTNNYANRLSYGVVNDNSGVRFWDWRWYGMIDQVALQVLLMEEWQRKMEEK